MSDSGNHLSFPFRIDKSGKTAQVNSLNQHVKDELIQLILTNLGERLFLPQFGGNVRKLVFENLDDSSAMMTKAHLTQSIEHWLGHRVTIENLEVLIQNSTVEVEIKYRISGTEDSRILKLQQTGK